MICCVTNVFALGLISTLDVLKYASSSETVQIPLRLISTLDILKFKLPIHNTFCTRFNINIRCIEIYS